jgi:hypothetical protein
VLILGALLLCFTLIGFLLVPWLIRRQLVAAAAKQLHRSATVSAVRFNPFTLETRIIAFDLRDRDGTPLFAFDTMVVNLSIMSVVHRAISLDEFRLVRPAAVARIDPQGNLAVADLLAGDSAAPGDTTATRPPRLEVRLLSLVDGRIDFVDESRSPRYEEEFNQLSLKVDGLSTLPNEKGDHVLTVSFASGAQVKWTGKNVFEPLNLEGQLELSRVRLRRVSEVFGAKYPLVITSGEAGAAFSYSVVQDSGRGLVVRVPEARFSAVEVAARARGVTDDWLRVPSAEVEGATLTWPARVAKIERLKVTDPWLSASREKDGSLNWTPIIDAFTVADSAPAATDSAPAWDLVLQQFELAGGSAHLADRSVTPAAEYELSHVNVRVTPVSTDPASSMRLEASATLGKRAAFTASGTAVREPFAADLEVAAKDIDVGLVTPYLGANAPAAIKSGVASASGKVKLRKTRPSTVFDGKASVTRFALDDKAKEPLLAWKDMRISGIHYTQAPDLLRIRQVTLDQPFARVAISRERTVNLMLLTEMMPADTTKPLKYEIGEVAINDARIDFSDESLILPFRTNIDSAYGTIKDVASFGGAPGTMKLEGKVEEYGLARTSGVIYVNDPYAATDIKADFRNLDMKSFTPYSAQFAGYAIADGRLDIDMEYRVKDRRLEANHHIVATDLKLGDKVEGGESPGFLVKLAVSLLKDKDGRIKLDVPVEGTVDDPQFNYKAIAWQAVKQVLGKVATAPFRFLGKALGIGGDGEDVDLVDFDPGRSDVIPPEQEKLDSLASEMGRKPELTLAVEGRYDSISDAQAIRERKLEARVTASRDSLGKKAQSDSITMSARILESLYAADHGKPALDSLREQFKLAFETDTLHKGAKFDATPMYAEIRTRLLAAETAEPAELVSLASARGTAIVTALTAAALDPARVTTAEPQPVSRKKSGSSRIPSELKMDAR